ncbi:FecR domain-containing protein [Luteimonas fraxinea]|uniref:FecR domain-containing protein n=1 Tax=Luteimonas fraxinea TaxID=2901869 RepID=A0ABS8UCQ3_9GAMM|nr:FecR domain-containing protein [Luteimonas fraxinea]MCD9097290.1 FecR domain-containing protein [Luteimonas fraxinea]MCD9125145.1 FecR domain-containing protein [Luteimonas fraxinea]UHH11552.1 FecR domain-containing protein [Luteimonas fraxinea]
MTAKLELIEGGDPVRRQAAAWFARQRADDVTIEETHAWQQWLAADARHRAAYARLERLWSGLGAHAAQPEIAARLAAVAAVQTPVTAAPGPAAPRARGGRWAVRLGMAAMLAVAIFGAWWTPAPPMLQDTLYATAVGAHREIVLDDGSRITLDTDTRLRVAYHDTERSLFLERGRAFFQVAHERRPMYVRTAHGSVRVVGTTFELDQRADALDVTLIEGRVNLLPVSGHDTDAPAVPMVAGHRARLAPGHAPRVVAMRDTAPPTWLSGRLVFEDTALADAVAEFNRYSHARLVVDDAALNGIRLTGVFRSDAPHAFVGALAKLHPIRIDVSTPGVMRLDAGHPSGSTARR